MSVNAIASSIAGLGKGSELAQPAFENDAEVGKTSFSQELNRSINQVNDLLNAADKATEELAVGRSENLHEAMIATEKAESAMKFLVQVRNKALDAYRDIMRMQV